MIHAELHSAAMLALPVAANDRLAGTPGCCGSCDLRPEDPRVSSCTRTDCPLGHHRRRFAKGAAADNHGRSSS
jgi:hypothetical protein